ncbi:PE-PPE domain-containing protein [Mycobacterium sp. CVI_P3]|uniref:PE-PPE domain-containing protein n=1 Tax=Mycobacterium pinniadriaticum TaxID=2994102 RepID=A0ABT3SGQ9_9MYCO|nr:PE-PPE domain-containing protein [Mycobacterium pinniadriaticum]MCX2932198.1 PE-PPE domain-containing protein [Mycobacterium pinniadriaticum]MCX2938702.1 PE-PPE domain-containing protein [Mycobacterium pinniadriaticum]
MGLSRALRAAAIAGTISAMLAIGFAAAPDVRAQTRITVPGAGPLYYPNIVAQLPVGRLYFFGTSEAVGPPLSILAAYDLLNHQIGENWFPGSTAQVVNYPASIGLLSFSLAAPGVDDAVAMGRVSLDDQIRNAVAGGDPVVVAGLSEGTLVVNRELAHLATTPGAPAADLVSFAMFGGPELGLADIYLRPGTWVPLMDYTARTLADSQYDVSVVVHQYDFWADPPDRPWNLLAVANALLGTVYFHDGTALATPSDAVVVSQVTSPLGGTTTTYLIPAPTLPLLKPLQQLGVSQRAIDVLKPVVDAGYSSLTPDAGPYFSHGRLVGLPARLSSPPTAATRVAPRARIGGPRERPRSVRASTIRAGAARSAPASRPAPAKPARVRPNSIARSAPRPTALRSHPASVS